MSGPYNSVTPFKLGSVKERNAKSSIKSDSNQSRSPNMTEGGNESRFINNLPSSQNSQQNTAFINNLPMFNQNNPLTFPPAGMHNPFFLPNVNMMSSTFQQPFQVPQSTLIPTTSGTLDNKISSKKRQKNSKYYEANNYQINNNIRNSMSSPLDDSEERRRKRAEKFSVPGKIANKKVDIVDNFSDLNAISSKSDMYDKNRKIVGNCQNLEKSYLRLTSEPDPNLVRPLSILKKHYANLVKMYKKKTTSYKYLCDQLKAIRQDLRVQMIENQFTVKIYQEHARLALENEDIGEFNQCQSRLFILFEKPNIKASCFEEFITYRILYYILTENYAQITELKLDLLENKLSVHNNFVVQIAFAMADAHMINNYHEFIELASLLDGKAQNLMNIFMDKIRMRALVAMCNSYNQINVSFLVDELKFSNFDEMESFLGKRNLSQYIVTKNAGEENEFTYLDSRNCRASVIKTYSSTRKIDIKGQQ